MAVLETIQALRLVPGTTVTFGPIAVITTLTTRVAQGFDRISGTCLATASVPPLAAGTLSIQQSMNGINWDHTDSFPVVQGGPDAPFDIVVIATYVRVTFVPDNPGDTITIRLHGLLKIG